MTGNSLHASEFLLTQKVLAHMLGVRGFGVTKAAGVLQRKNLIHYNRGNIKILNQKGLEAAACACYRIVKDLQDDAQA